MYIRMSIRNNIKYAFENLKKFWRFIWYDDSLLSYILNFFLAFVFIKYIFFPGIGFALNTDFPIVAIVSGSMEHKIVDHTVCDKTGLPDKSKSLTLDEWWLYCSEYYSENYDISLSQFKEFKYENGLNIGDVMILYGKDPKEIEIGEILVFIPQDRNFYVTKGPVIHRVVQKWEDNSGKVHFQTKGDHNRKSFNGFENDIPQEDVLGVGVVRIPYIGYAKLVLNYIINLFV